MGELHAGSSDFKYCSLLDGTVPASIKLLGVACGLYYNMYVCVCVCVCVCV